MRTIFRLVPGSVPGENGSMSPRSTLARLLKWCAAPIRRPREEFTRTPVEGRLTRSSSGAMGIGDGSTEAAP